MNKMEEMMTNSDRVCCDGKKDNGENMIYVDIFSGDIFEFQSSHPGSKIFPPCGEEAQRYS